MKRNLILLFILTLAWLIPDFIVLLSSNKISQPLKVKDTVTTGVIEVVKENMDTLQTMLETYAFDHDGNYPNQLSDLYKAALLEPSYIQTLKNPFTKKAQSIIDKEVAVNIWAYKESNGFKGVLIYRSLRDKNNKIKSYKIYGSDGRSKLIRTKKNELFKLTNLKLF